MMWFTNSISVGRRRTYSDSHSPADVDLQTSNPISALDNLRPQKLELRQRRASQGSKFHPRTPIEEMSELVFTNHATPASRPPRRPRTITLPSEVNFDSSEMSPLYTTHKDFTPKASQVLHDLETFAEVLKKANSWLLAHPDLMVITCESITWSSSEHVPVFTDSTIIKSGGRQTKFTRGLRLWCATRTPEFQDKAYQNDSQLVYRDYCPSSGTTVTALQMINEDILNRPIHGAVLKAETLHKPESIDTEIASWTESLDSSRRYTTFIRVFFLVHPDSPLTDGEIVLRDFCPKYDEKSPHNDGWQRYEDLFSQASHWISQAAPVTFHLLNIQTVCVKMKKDVAHDKVHHINLWEPLLHKEYGAGKKTDYLHIVRVAYTRPRPSSPYCKPHPIPYDISYKTFIPESLTQVTNLLDISEKNFEELRTLVARIKSWILSTGLKPVHIETLQIPYQQTCQGMTTETSDSVYTFNYRLKNVPQPKIVCLRVYVNKMPHVVTRLRRDSQTQTP